MTDYTCHAIVIRDGRRVFCHLPAVATTRCYYPAPFTLGYCDEHRPPPPPYDSGNRPIGEDAPTMRGRR